MTAQTKNPKITEMIVRKTTVRPVKIKEIVGAKIKKTLEMTKMAATMITRMMMALKSCQLVKERWTI